MRKMPQNRIGFINENSGMTIFLFLLILFSGCRHNREGIVQLSEYPAIYPDYINVTIPFNIAPLNFKLKEKCRKVEVTLKDGESTLKLGSAYKINIPGSKWKKLLAANKNDSIIVTVSAFISGRWVRYKPFYFYISGDAVDPFLSYRLIEPGYEVWHKLQICQRNLENFEESVIVDNNLLEGACVNCHIYSHNDPSLSFFHLRNKNGGTIIQQHGEIRKINTSTDRTISAGVYGNWHPGGRFIAFSTNVIIPEFHSINNLRLEVYDTTSDVVVLDLEKNEILRDPLLSAENELETFPVFSTDGKQLFFTSAKKKSMPANYRSVKYSLCETGFNSDSASFGTKIDTLVSSYKTGKSVSQPVPSPDGKYLLFTSFDYGTFPVWHKEADLHLLKLSDLSIDNISVVNSDNSESYHSWSSNSRWFVFASKRDDGMYGKAYFAHIDEDGRCSKPFLLPQKNADFYEFFLKSYNIPELAKGAVRFTPVDIEHAYRDLKAETVKSVNR